MDERLATYVGIPEGADVRVYVKKRTEGESLRIPLVMRVHQAACPEVTWLVHNLMLDGQPFLYRAEEHPGHYYVRKADDGTCLGYVGE